ncbi:MAG: Do family serine endopeptidase [Phycisphaerae bacterium]|jgi:serine protease Do
MLGYQTQSDRRSARNLLICVVLILFSLSPVIYAQDESSIATLRQIGTAFSTIADKTSPAVVGIKADKVYTQRSSDMPYWFFDDPFFNDDFFERFFGRPNPRQNPQQQQKQPRERKVVQPVQGSGFLISADGYILTNNHLVGDSENVRVQLSDDKEVKAKVIGSDPESDVALIKVDETNLPYLELADSDALQVGEWVIAIGSPFGLSHTVTAGIVSAKGRSDVGITTYEDFIQTDAAINPGNSGGPLLNLDGKAVGINTAIVSRSGGNMGIGLAIPINMAKSIYEQLMSEGKVVRGYLGISLQDLTPELAENFGLKQSEGAIVTSVVDDSPAAKADVKFEDVIVEFQGKPVTDSRDLMKRVALLTPGTKVELVVVRNEKRETIEVELGERPKPDEMRGTDEAPATVYDLGFEVQNLTSDMAERLGVEGTRGVVVVDVRRGSPADLSGIEAGLVITKVGKVDIANTKEFYSEIKKVKKGETVVLLVTDGQQRRFVTLEVPEPEED